MYASKTALSDARSALERVLVFLSKTAGNEELFPRWPLGFVAEVFVMLERWRLIR